MKTASWKKVVALMVAAMMIFVIGCSSNNSGGNNGNATPPANSSGNNEDAPAEEEPEEVVTIRVSLWDRGTAPEGQKITDTIMTRWINEQVKDLNIQVEFVPLPRAEEEEKLNTWMAAGSAPDVVLTYSPDVFVKFASQGGLAPLDESIEKFGQDIMVNNKVAMEGAGVYDGVRYAVMARKPNENGPAMKIRQDWLDAVGMEKPTTVDELYEVLKAFKEQNPGGVDNVVPWSVPSLDHLIHFGPSLGFGIDMAGPGTTLYMASGNIIDNKFVSHVATPEGREYFKWLNKLYKEELIPKEFITDVNNEKFTENITSGRSGFFEDNKGAWNWDTTMKDMEGVNWEFVPPLVAPDGEQQVSIGYPFGMFIMVPKTSADKTDAVVKYLDWMSDEEVSLTLQQGFEGEHYEVVDGIRMPIDVDKNKADYGWYAADIAIMSLGVPNYSSEVALVQYAPQGEDFAQDVVEHREAMKEHGVYQPLLTNERPWAEKNASTMDAMLLEELSKVIISGNFDADYDAMLSKWKQMGGETYDAEITEGLKVNGVIK